MAKKINVPKYIKDAGARIVPARNGLYKLVGKREAGYGIKFQLEAARVIEWLEKHNMNINLIKYEHWWEHYETYEDAAKADWFNYTLVSMDVTTYGFLVMAAADT